MAQDIGKIEGRKRLAVFASGTGTNASRLIEHFRENAAGEVVLLVCNKPGAGVIGIAEKAGIPVLMIEKERFKADGYVAELKAAKVDFLLLAGFLWKLPSVLIASWAHRILNIHPALLPKYGGKGMYGERVHRAVLDAGDVESGISIHEVDEQYDHGPTLFQARCPVLNTDSPESLAARIHELEHRHYPEVAERFISRS
jgi:phosphoribosylglycinamide formyltransferase-1